MSSSPSSSTNPARREVKPGGIDATAGREKRAAQQQDARKAQREKKLEEARAASASEKKVVDYNAVRKDVADLVKEKGCHPILVRLSWHDAGTFDEESGTGGPRAVMRFAEKGEATYGCNNGLDIARNLLQPIKDKYGDQIGYADLWALAAVVAIKEAGGPDIPIRSGRVDAESADASVPDGRLPDGDKYVDHLRSIFHRMGMSDQEIVALSGAHTLGRCHKDRSGFDGPWGDNPLKFDNSYFKDVLEKKWDDQVVEETSNPQLSDGKGNMMLRTDMCLKDDDKMKPFVELYAKDQEKFFEDFAKAFQKLQELGYSDDVLNGDM